MEHLLALYHKPYDPKRPLVCFDEKSTQLLAHITDPRLLKPGQALRQDYEYKRNGTRNLFLFVEPKAGSRHVLDVCEPIVVLYAFLDKGCSGHPESWLLPKTLHQEREVVGRERDVGIEIADYIVLEVANNLESRVEALDLRREIPFTPILQPEQLNPVVRLQV